MSAPLLQQLLVDTCSRLNHDSAPGRDVVDYLRDPMGDALVALLLDDAGPATTLVTACLYSAHLHSPATLASAVDHVAAAAGDVERGYRVDDDGSHDRPCTHATGCDACEQWWNDRLDDAVRELLVVLGDQAQAHLAAVAAVGAGVAA